MYFKGVLYINPSNNIRYYNLESVVGQLHVSEGIVLPYLKKVNGLFTATNKKNEIISWHEFSNQSSVLHFDNGLDFIHESNLQINNPLVVNCKQTQPIV